MWNRCEVGTGRCAGFFQPGPQVFRVGAVVEPEGVILLGGRCIAVGHHYAVQVGASGNGAPFPADHGRELARYVVLVGDVSNGAPGIDFNLMVHG